MIHRRLRTTRPMLRLVATIAITFHGSAALASRVALVVSESAYESVAPLDNPGRDAGLIVKALTESGFDTIHAKANLNKAEFDRALRDFKRLADSADVSLVYYAGHGIELDGQNWLLPVDARLDDPADVVVEAVPLETVLHFLAGTRQLRIVVLDACRDNPFALRLATRGLKRGLSPVEGLARGTIVAYSASLGQKAQDGPVDGNSPFAESLARRLVEPGLEVRFLFAHVRDDVLASYPGQEPWIGTSLSAEEVYFVPPTSNRAEELAAFGEAAKRWTPEAWRSFLTAHPRGEFQTAAKEALAGLEARHAPSTVASRFPLRSVEQARVALDALGEQQLRTGEPLLLVTKVVSASSGDALLVLAEAGDPRAQRLAARAFRTGLAGFPVDPARAAGLLKRAAEQGDAASQAALGFLYDRGDGVPKDQQEAGRLYALAASAGDPIGQANLGAMHQFGLGGFKVDEAEAVGLYIASAAQGNPLGQANLGSMYQFGLGGLKRDERQAATLFRLAAAQGNPTGQANLGVLIEVGAAGLAANPSEAVRLYRLAADQGNSVGQANLAYALERGIGGLKVDKAEAVRLYRLAALQELKWAREQLVRLGIETSP